MTTLSKRQYLRSDPTVQPKQPDAHEGNEGPPLAHELGSFESLYDAMRQPGAISSGVRHDAFLAMSAAAPKKFIPGSTYGCVVGYQNRLKNTKRREPAVNFNVFRVKKRYEKDMPQAWITAISSKRKVFS